MAKRKREATAEEIIRSFGEDERALALYLRDDPVAFAKLICGVTPHPAQAEFLQLPVEDCYHVMLPWARQRGKSEVVYILIAHRLFALPNFSVFCFAPSGGQTKVIFDRIAHLYATNPFLKRYMPSSLNGETLYVGDEKWNSKVELVKVGLTGNLGRSRSTSGKGLIVYDEFAQFMYSETVRSSLSPICSSGGGEVILSSPSGPGSPMHKLYKTWKQLEAEGNKRYRVIECDYFPPHVKPEWIEDLRREHESAGNLWFYEQEYLGKWVAPSNTWFPHDDIRRCILATKPECKRGDVYVWGMDAAGRGRSAFVVAVARFNQALSRLEVVDLRSFMLKADHKYHREEAGSEIVTDFEQIVEICCDLRDKYPPAWCGFDPNTERSLFGRLESSYRFPMKEILVGGYEQKVRFLNSLRKGIAEARVVWSDERITQQLQSFCPRKDEATGRYRWPDSGTDIIVAVGNIYQYLGLREETPFAVATSNRPSGGKWALW